MRKCEVLGMLNPGFSLILQGDYSVGAFFTFFIKVSKHLRKCVPKWFPKGSNMHPTWLLGFRTALGSLWGTLGGSSRLLSDSVFHFAFHFWFQNRSNLVAFSLPTAGSGMIAKTKILDDRAALVEPFQLLGSILE